MLTVEEIIKQLENYPKDFFVFASEDVGGNGLTIVNPDDKHSEANGFIPTPHSD